MGKLQAMSMVFNLAILLTAAAGAGLCAWMLRMTRGGRGLPGCGADSPCDHVLASRWSRLGALPVLLPAVLLYGGIAAMAGLALLAEPVAKWEFLPAVLRGTCLLAGGAAVWFIVLQGLVLRRWCLFCTLIHLSGLTLAGLAMGSAWLATSTGTPLAAAAAGVTLLAVGQIVLEPRLYRITPHDPAAKPGEVTPPPPAPTKVAGEPSARPSRPVVLLGGRVTIDAACYPRLGPADAKHELVYIFDYTCPSCRKTHAMLRAALERLETPLAVLMVPSPVDPSCNPHRSRQLAEHAFACRYARLGLMFWRRFPQAYDAFDRRMFEGEEPPPLGVARSIAQELSGADDLDASIPDPEFDAPIAQGIALHQAAATEKMPTLLFPRSTLSGQVPSVERLMEICREQFDG